MPAMTSLLNGQAVKVWLASTSVTVMRGSRLLQRARAGRAGEAAADHDDAPARALRERGHRQAWQPMRLGGCGFRRVALERRRVGSHAAVMTLNPSAPRTRPRWP